MLDVTLQPRVEEPVEEVKVKALYDWRWENSVNAGPLINIDDEQEFKYNKWRTLSSLSNNRDTCVYANIMNINHHISDKMHYHWLYYSIRKQKRYGKRKTDDDRKQEKLWEKEQKLIALLQKHYKYNYKKAREALKVLTKNQLDIIVEKEEKGG
jgi:hypothetical protein